MTNQPEPLESEGPATLSVVVERTGGFAGLTRTWRVDAVAAEYSRWADLVDQCPWERLPPPPTKGADRFSWIVSTHRGRERRHAELAEQELTGPWKELIDAVRDRAQTERARSASTPPEE